jgi:hypothetical protein
MENDVLDALRSCASLSALTLPSATVFVRMERTDESMLSGKSEPSAIALLSGSMMNSTLGNMG